MQIAHRLALAAAATALAVTPAAFAQGRGNGNGNGGGGNGGGGGGGGGANTIPSPVLLASERGHQMFFGFWTGRGSSGSMAVPVTMRTDGKGLEFVLCPSIDGDLTHGGGTRWVADFFPLNATPSQGIVAHSDDCLDGNPSYVATLLDDSSFTYPTGFLGASQVRWSIDGSRLAFSAIKNGIPGIFVGEILFDAEGRPAGIWDGISLSGSNPVPNTVRTVVTTSGVTLVRWSGDNTRLTFAVPDAGGNNDVWVVDVDSGALANVTNTPTQNETAPAFSPVPGDNRIVFSRFMFAGDPTVNFDDRWDLFIVDLGSMSETQVTNESNAGVDQIQFPEWSPDAQFLVFNGGGVLSAPDKLAIHKIAADGSSNAKQLTRWKVSDGNFLNVIHGKVRWRD